MTRRGLLLAVSAMLLAATLATRRSAAEDDALARAEADRRAVVAEVHAFCERPRVPPSGEAIRLCAFAREIEGCDGFVKQCDEILRPKEPPSSPLLEWLARVVGAIAEPAGWLILIGGVATALYFIVAAIVARFRAPPVEDEPAPASATVSLVAKEPPPPATGSPEALLARAEAALLRGELREALFGFLHAALRALEVKGVLRLTRDRTNGEYVRACRDEAARPELRAIVREVDLVQFGSRAPELEQVKRVGERAALLVRLAQTTLLVLLAMGLLGCKSTLFPRGSDPAGFEVAEALLKRQGFTLTKPKAPLARLTAPAAGEPPKAIFVVGAKAQIDDDAAAGLDRFVRGGGRVVLFGPRWSWPKPWKTAHESAKGREVAIGPVLQYDCDDASDECEEQAKAALAAHAERPTTPGHLAGPAAFRWEGQAGRTVASFVDGGAPYASIGEFEKGFVLAIATSDLITNVGLAREGNGAALIALLSHLGTKELIVVDALGGITPSSDPLSALLRAGLGLPLGHAFAFCLLLALAVGARARWPRRAPPEARRAFAEHVEATAALYAFGKASPLALAAYGRFVVERLRARAVRGHDAAGTLAQRSGATRDECQALLDRATHTKAGDERKGDELHTLARLSELYAKAEEPLHQAAKRGGLRSAKKRT